VCTYLQVFENSLWLFFTHPFDVGDRIKYQGDRYSILSIKLQRVNMTRVDGANVMVPTEQMRTSLIHNISRCLPISLCESFWVVAGIASSSGVSFSCTDIMHAIFVQESFTRQLHDLYSVSVRQVGPLVARH
jgi:hypothetical protein